MCLQSRHNDTVSKLDFVLSLSELVINLARLHTSPLSTSSSSLAGDQLRLVEQLVLKLHALQLLASSLQLARCELRSGHLHPSSTVRHSTFHTSATDTSISNSSRTSCITLDFFNLLIITYWLRLQQVRDLGVFGKSRLNAGRCQHRCSAHRLFIAKTNETSLGLSILD